MTNDTTTTAAGSAETAIDRGRAAVTGAVRDVVEEVRGASSPGDAARSLGRRISRLRDEQPLAFGIGIAVSAIVLAGLVSRAQR